MCNLPLFAGKLPTNRRPSIGFPTATTAASTVRNQSSSRPRRRRRRRTEPPSGTGAHARVVQAVVRAGGAVACVAAGFVSCMSKVLGQLGGRRRREQNAAQRNILVQGSRLVAGTRRVDVVLVRLEQIDAAQVGLHAVSGAGHPFSGLWHVG